MFFSDEQRAALYAANLARNIDYYRQACVQPGTTKLSAGLLDQLGSPYYHVRAGGYDIGVRSGSVPLPCNVQCLDAQLPSLVALISEAPSCLVLSDLQALLTAVGEREAWRECRLTYHGSYGLAQCLLSSADLRRHAHLRQFADLVTPAMLRVLNGWLQPTRPWLEIPDEEIIATALFGSGWWSLCGQSSGVGTTASVCSSVHGQKPPFMSDLVAWEKQDVVMTLPEIDTW